MVCKGEAGQGETTWQGETTCLHCKGRFEVHFSLGAPTKKKPRRAKFVTPHCVNITLIRILIWVVLLSQASPTGRPGTIHCIWQVVVQNSHPCNTNTHIHHTQHLLTHTHTQRPCQVPLALHDGGCVHQNRSLPRCCLGQRIPLQAPSFPCGRCRRGSAPRQHSQGSGPVNYSGFVFHRSAGVGFFIHGIGRY